MTLRLWVLSILPVLSLAASSASVYLSPSPAFGSSFQAAEELSASQAELLLTHHLGLDPALPLDSNDAWWSSIIQQAGGQGVLGQELMSSMNRDAVVVVFEANSEDLHDFLPNSLHESTFRFHADTSSLDSLVTAYATRAAHAYSSVSSSANPPSYKTGSLDTGVLGLYDFAATSPAAEAFMSEFSALAAFGEGVRDVSETTFGAFAIHSLPALKAEFGRDSEEYKTAVLALKAALTTPAVRSSNLALIFLNSRESSHPRSETVNPAAAQSSQAPFPAFPPGNAPIYSHSVCHLTADSCVNGTSECSGRGRCVSVRKGPRACFVCQCTATKDSKNRTEYWSGSACQTQDRSVAFTLLAGTAITVTLLIGLTISLLMGIGAEELPSVLVGGAVPKRD